MPTTYTRGRIYKIPLADLQADPGQPRKYIDPGALAELTASIAKLGVLEPILFRVDDQGKLTVVAGERRVEAARSAGLTQIPGLFVEGNHREISLVENLLRQDLTPIEEAEGMKQVMNECSYTQIQLSEMLGKAQSSVSGTLSLNNLPEDVKNACRSNTNIPKTALIEIAKGKTEAVMRRKFERWMAKESAKTQATKPAARPPVSKSRAFLVKMDALHTELAELPWQDWPEADREDLAGCLQDMRGTASEILAAMGDSDLEIVAEEAKPTSTLR